MSEGQSRGRAGLSGYFPKHLVALAKEIRSLIKEADRDCDPVSITVLSQGPNGDDLAADGAVVILKGGDTVALFCQWAERNKVLTRGKPIGDRAEQQESHGHV